MIRHIVLFSAKDKQDLHTIHQGLSILRDIPHARTLEVVLNEKHDAWSDEIDVVVYGEFDDEAALAAYKAHPLYEESIRRVRPLRETRIAVDFTSPARG
ncbi:Dabb family protein [Caenispirillum bisanense]|uniref:Dabb family protein n=1 Tax=Caenispirillum bisanense TaxID=414052 RepID=UPI0031DDFD99